MNIGENIKKFRKKKGMTQAELAELVSKSLSRMERPIYTQTVSYWENGRDPGTSNIEAIAHALGITIPELLGYPESIVIYKELELTQVSTEALLYEIKRRCEK